MTAQDAASLVRTLYDLYNAHQSDSAWLDKCLAIISEDCEVINVPFGMTVRGPEGYQQLMLGWTQAFPESGNKKTKVVATEEGAVAEYIGHGIHTGPMQSPAGEIAATGRKVELPFCDVYRVRDGKIISLHQYYDALGFMQQLGLVPAMG